MHGGGEREKKKKSHSCWQNAWSFESRIKKKKREDEEENLHVITGDTLYISGLTAVIKPWSCILPSKQ